VTESKGAVYDHISKSLDAYRKYFEAGGRRRDPLTNAYEYVRTFGPRDSKIDEEVIEQDADLWKAMPLDIHSRMFPYNGQKHTILLNNPGMVRRLSEFISRGEGRRLHDAKDDLERRSEISAHYFSEYVNGHNGWQMLFDALNEVTSTLDVGPREDRREYIQAEAAEQYREAEPNAPLRIDTSQGLYGDFYVTNAHKFSTPRSSHVWSSAIQTVASEYFPRELELVQPQTTIVMGGIAWQVFEKAVGAEHLTPIADSTRPDDFNEYRGGAFEFDGQYAVVIRHPGMLNKIGQSRLQDLFGQVADRNAL